MTGDARTSDGFAELFGAAGEYHDHFEPDALSAAPTRHLVVLTCMDARLDLFRLLGLEIGDAHILRNAGGRATADALRSLVVSANTLGTRRILVIHHTTCGLHGETNESMRKRVAEISGRDPVEMDFYTFPDIEQSVREDVQRIRACPYLPDGVEVQGAIYAVETGSLTAVRD